MARWAIKHIPTGKYYCEDEGGAYIVDGDEGIISWDPIILGMNIIGKIRNILK